MNKLSPSLLSADFTHLAEAVEVIPYLHVDVMDGVFVPNISIGVPVVKSLRKITDLVLDVHLMIIDPERYIEAFANAGADIINIHYEACRKCKDTLIKSPAITIKPKTDWKEIIDLLPYVDMVLVMSVEPGFGGQKFIESTLENVKGLADYKKEHNMNFDIEIDGGVNADNLHRPLEAGANIIVAGSAIYGKEDIPSEIKKFKEIMDRYED